MCHKNSPKDIILQINVPHSREMRYVQLSNLKKALENDPDIACLPQDYLPNIFQMLFVLSGCDFISYFHAFGKGAFLNTFYQYADFISGKYVTGLVYHISENDKNIGFLSFIQLVGSLYFKKHY